MAAQGKILNLNPNYVGNPTEIDAQQAALTKNVQDFGNSQSANIGNIYSGLGTQLTQNAAGIQDTYNQGNRNLSEVFNQAGDSNSDSLANILTQLRGSGASLGSGQDAINAVIAGAGKQAADYSVKNQQKLTERLGANTQLGTNMTALAKMGVASAAKAAAQGKKDLSDRIIQQVQSLGSAAMMGKGAYYNKEAQRQEKEAAKAMAEVLSNQRADRADARAERSAARADARAEKSGSGKTDPFALAQFKHDLAAGDYNDRHPTAPTDFGLGPEGNRAAAALYGGADPETVFASIRRPRGGELDRMAVNRAALGGGRR